MFLLQLFRNENHYLLLYLRSLFLNVLDTKFELTLGINAILFGTAPVTLEILFEVKLQSTTARLFPSLLQK